MADDLRRALHQILQKVDGLQGIILTDRDGVTILKAHLEPPTGAAAAAAAAASANGGGGSNSSPPADIFPESALRLNFLATFGTATEQAGKLGMGRNDKIISIYGKYQVIQFNRMPVVVTLIARKDANTGYLLTSMEEVLSPLVNEIRKDVTAYYHNHLLNTGDV